MPIGDPGLLDVVAGAARVEGRVDEGEEAVDLVGLEHAREDGGRRRTGRTGHQQDEPAAPGTGDREHAEDGRGQDEHRAEVGLEQDQDGGYGGDGQHQGDVGPADVRPPTAFGPLGQDQRHPDDDGELRELRRLDRTDRRAAATTASR